MEAENLFQIFVDDNKMTKWKTAIIDPPWPEYGGGGRGAQNHYPLLKVDQISSCIRNSGEWFPENDAHLYMWTTSTYLPDALRIISELGFDYKTNIVWSKKKFGLGRYFRGKHELLLFATKGRGWDVRTNKNNIPSLIEAEHVKIDGKIVHSAKPDAFYDLVEARSLGPYIEFFARRKRINWTSWGNEIK